MVFDTVVFMPIFFFLIKNIIPFNFASIKVDFNNYALTSLESLIQNG